MYPSPFASSLVSKAVLDAIEIGTVDYTRPDHYYVVAIDFGETPTLLTATEDKAVALNVVNSAKLQDDLSEIAVEKPGAGLTRYLYNPVTNGLTTVHTYALEPKVYMH